jgi:hypothetical protein
VYRGGARCQSQEPLRDLRTRRAPEPLTRGLAGLVAVKTQMGILAIGWAVERLPHRDECTSMVRGESSPCLFFLARTEGTSIGAQSWTDLSNNPPNQRPIRGETTNGHGGWGAGGPCAFPLGGIFEFQVVQDAERLPLAQFQQRPDARFYPVTKFEKRRFHDLHGPVVEPISAARGGEKNSACCTFACKGISGGAGEGG